MNKSTEPNPTLAPPGAGIPFLQRILLRYVFFPRFAKKMSWEAAQKFFRKEGDKILALAEKSPAVLQRRVLVKPMMGLEDSSRYWSVSMAMEHLIIVGRAISDGIVMLTQGRVPSVKADTAKVKPFENLPAEKVIPKFRAFLNEFLEKTSGNIGDRQSKTTHLHPWFGPLTPAQWMALAPIHQRLHRKQMEEILKI